MLADIEYDFINFNGWREDKSKDGIPMEMYDLKLKRYEHLLKFFNKLGFIEKDNINIDKDFVGEDFKILLDDYKDIDVKALNTMMTDGHIRISNEINTKSIKSIFNQLLRDEFGMEVANNGVKYIKVDGKKKKLTKMCVRNYCPKSSKWNGLSKAEAEYEAKKFGSSKFNKFNIYKKRFDEELEIEFNDNFDEEEDEEYFESSDDENPLDIGIKGHCFGCGRKCLLEKCIKCMTGTQL